MSIRGAAVRLAVLAAVATAWASARQVPDAALFDAEIRRAVREVPAFVEVAERARSLGVHVWLFGGAAATVASAVRRRVLGEDPSTPFALDDLFHSAQDIDLAVDGDEKSVEAFAQWLADRPPFLPDGRSAWELRQLHRSTGPKGPLLGDPTFFAQHSDTQSTGVVALTADDEIPMLRDLVAWDSAESPFVEDARHGRIRFQFRESHGATPRASAGLNPPIFAAVRYWIKVLGLGLETRAEDEAKVQSIIDAFDPESDLETPYARYWLERNGKKLLLYARQLERARALLERTGLASKLAAASRQYWNSKEGQALREKEADSKNPSRTLEQWLDRVPLPGFDVGSGDGPTARELGIDDVAHETVDYGSWEILQRSPQGAPNLFSSRQGHDGEHASYGDGFYVRVGKSGARDTGFTVRFRLRPEAREGTDFERASTYVDRRGITILGPPKDFVVIKNRLALVLVPETEPNDARELLESIAAGRFSKDDRGIIERQLRRIAAGPTLTPDEALRLRDVVLGNVGGSHGTLLLNAWIRSPWARTYPEPFDRGLERVRISLTDSDESPATLPVWLRELLTNPVWVAMPDAVGRFRTLLESTCPAAQYLEEVAEILAQDAWQKKPEWISLVATALASSRRGYRHRWLAKHVFALDRWLHEPRAGELLRDLVRGSGGDPDAVDYVVDHVLAKPGWENHPDAAAILVACFEVTPLPQHPFLADRMDRSLFRRAEWQTSPSVSSAVRGRAPSGYAIQHLWRQRLCSTRLAAS